MHLLLNEASNESAPILGEQYPSSDRSECGKERAYAPNSFIAAMVLSMPRMPISRLRL